MWAAHMLLSARRDGSDRSEIITGFAAHRPHSTATSVI